MAAKGRTIGTDEGAALRTAAARVPAVSMRARTGGYVVDMVIFGAMVTVLLVLAGLLLLFSTDWAQEDATDAELYTFLGVIGIGAPFVWSFMNVALLLVRAQTGGQYVAGLRLCSEDGSRPGPGQVVGWWFCVNPLLFSWPMALAAGLPLAAVIALILSRATIAIFGGLIVLCALAPPVAFISVLLDARNRALHDRVAGVIVAGVE